MTRMSRCPVPGCQTLTQTRKAFCRRHWRALPKPLRDQLWAAYRAKDRAESFRLVVAGARMLRGAEGNS